MWHRCPICLKDTIKSNVFTDSDTPDHYFNDAEITEQRCACQLDDQQTGTILDEAVKWCEEGIFEDAHDLAYERY